MTIINNLDLDGLVLKAGAHSSQDEFCIMEAVAYIAGEPWTDHPRCASPVITSFLMRWNDALDETDRQTLKRYILPLIGSRGTTEQEEQRGWMAFDWLIRVQVPTWLKLAGLDDHASYLSGLSPITGRGDFDASLRTTLVTIRAAAWARRDAGAAAAVATATAAVAATAAAAATVATAAATVAAAAADVAADADAVAARRSARAALAPTVRELQRSAHDLVGRMLAVTGQPINVPG